VGILHTPKTYEASLRLQKTETRNRTLSPNLIIINSPLCYHKNRTKYSHQHSKPKSCSATGFEPPCPLRVAHSGLSSPSDVPVHQQVHP
jgi:hypothetical protein